ncbi:MAG: hypothetical protein DRP45_07940, partial [Candidatus Zixiibacteriota bacterium]
MLFQQSARAILILSAIAVGLTSTGWAQFASPGDFLDPADRKLFVDYAYFRTEDSNTVRLELYYKVFNEGLTFVKHADEYYAEYELVVAIDDKDGDRVETLSSDRRIVVAAAERTRSVSDFRTSQINRNLPVGKYNIEFSLRDKNDQKVTRRELKIKLPDFRDDRAVMSPVEFVQAFSKRNEKASVFDKGEMAVVPSVTHTFGGDEGGRLVYYFEIYKGSGSDEKVTVETLVRHRSNDLVYRDTLSVVFGSETERQLREISLDEFSPGEYELEIRLLGRRMKKLSQQKYPFEVLWTLSGLIRNDWESTVEQLSIICEPGETDQMEKLTTFEERKRAFEEF